MDRACVGIEAELAHPGRTSMTRPAMHAQPLAATAAPVAASESVFALVTGGGTGGHVTPALAVAEELVRRGHPRTDIRFVGSRRGMEASAVPAAGFAIDLLPGRGVRRSLGLRALRDNAGALLGTVGAFGRALRLVGRLRPRVVLGVGGYASLPCVVAARLRGIPTVVHEQNRAPGLANRVGVRLGARAVTSLPDTPLRGAVVTGNPVRREVAAARRAPASPPMVAIVGGSLGAVRLNDAGLALYDRWRTRTDVVVHHVSGRRNYEECRRRLDMQRRTDDVLVYELVAYEDRMELLYERASLLVCRAGAVTVAELAVTGTPALLVPLPGAPDDHQTRNAESLVSAGAAVLVVDDDLDGDRLDAELTALLATPERLHVMGEAARSCGRPDAAARVADVMEGIAR
jgi:undecaprenyldiphospho-muramoylpentapeptide beta-N-acetylglucosaminyltransferase